LSELDERGKIAKSGPREGKGPNSENGGGLEFKFKGHKKAKREAVLMIRPPQHPGAINPEKITWEAVHKMAAD